MLFRSGIFAVLLAGCVVCSFVQTALNVALVPIMVQMHITASVAQWLTSSYSLVMGIMVLATAFLIRRFPARPLFLVDMAIFMAGLLLSATAGNFAILLIGRLLQAVGCGILLSLTQVVVLTIYPSGKRGSVMGVFGLAVTAAPVLSPTLAGVLIDRYNWQMLFWISLVIAVVVTAAGSIVLENTIKTEKQRFDLLSMILCSIGFSGLLLGAGQFGSYPLLDYRIWLPIIIGLTASVIFVIRQLAIEKPLIELRIFKNHEFRVAVFASMILYGVMIAGSVLIPIYSQSLRSFSATQTGLITLPGSLATAIGSLIAGRLYDRIGMQKLSLGGSFLLLFGSVGLISLDSDTTVAMMMVYFIVRQTGMGFLMMPIYTWGISKLPQTHYSDGTALLGSLRTVAGAMGAAALVAVMTAVSGMQNQQDPYLGVRVSFIVMAVLALILLMVTIFLIGQRSLRFTPDLRTDSVPSGDLNKPDKP